MTGETDARPDVTASALEELRRECEALRAQNAELARFIEIRRHLDAAMAEQGAVLAWTQAALRGEEVSEFGRSFHLVGLAVEIREELEDLRRDRDLGKWRQP